MKTEITVKRAYKDEDKLTPQAKVIIDHVTAKVGMNKPMDRAELIAELDKAGTLKTRQGAGRVITFYQNTLSEKGIIHLHRTATEKPAKEPKAEKAGEPSKPGAKKPAAAAA